MKKLIPLCFLALFTFVLQAQIDSTELVFHWDDSTLVGSEAYDNTYNEVWGFVENEREYAVIGSTDGTHIFDLTNTENIYMADYIPAGYQGVGVIHRDYHDYNGYLYVVCDEGVNFSTLQIIDLSSLPDSATVVYDSNDLFARSHNIFIDTASALLYVAGGREFQGPGFFTRVYDLADPTNPQFVYEYPARYVHDMYVRNDTAFFNEGDEGMTILDFSDPANPIVLATFEDYSEFGQGYNHSGWLSEDGKTYYLCDETWSLPVKAIDVSDMSDLKVISTFSSDINPQSIVHNPLIRGDYLFAGYYYDGLQVFDVSDPANPFKVRQYFTSNIAHNNSYEGAWGVYPNLPSGNIIVGDMQEGLFIIDVNLGLEPMMEDTTMVEDSTVMGIFDAQAFELKIAPNPATNVFNIEGLSDGEQVQMINLYNQAGQLVWRKKVSNNYDKTIVRPEVSNGFYMIELVNNKGERYLGKIVFE